MKSFVILLVTSATALAGVKDKDFMTMWPTYFSRSPLYGNDAKYLCPANK